MDLLLLFCMFLSTDPPGLVPPPLPMSKQTSTVVEGMAGTGELKSILAGRKRIYDINEISWGAITLVVTKRL